MLYSCQICKFNFKTIRKHGLHQSLHRNTPGALFRCLYSGCNQNFFSYPKFKNHTYRHHSVQITTGLVTYFKCDIDGCSFTSKIDKEIRAHVYLHLKQGIKVKCPFTKYCHYNLLFCNVNTMRQHIMRKHTHLNQKSCNTSSLTGANINVIHPNISEEKFADCGSDDLQALYKQLLSSLYLTLESKYFLPNKLLQLFIDGMRDLNDLNNKYILLQLKTHTNIEALLRENLFNKAHCRDGPLRNKFCREKYYKKHFNYVKPKCIPLENGSNFFYVSIIDTVEMLLKNKNFNMQYFSKRHSSFESLCDICDGMLYKTNTLFSKDHTAAQIILFQDAFEVCNPIGAFRNKHKIVGVYMMLGNIPTWYRSRVEHIQLVALVYEKDLKRFGFSEVFQVIMDDIQKLEEGVEYLVDNKILNLKETGCFGWQPEKPTDPAPNISKEILNQLEETDEKFLSLLESTYFEQRSYLNNLDNPPTVIDIIREWPVLFKETAIKWHFKKLTNKDIGTLKNMICRKAEKIVKLGNMKKIKFAAHHDQSYESLQIIAAYFKEDLSIFHYRIEEEDGNLVEEHLNAWPCIVETVNENTVFQIFFEKKQIIECASFLDAFGMCFAIFFIFNLEYPRGLSTFFEMIQRYFLKIHPDSGTKSKKLNISKKKVIQLINKLSQM